MKKQDKVAQLHYWYMDEKIFEDKKYRIMHGNVSGHKKLEDSLFIHTSEVLDFKVVGHEMIVRTRNTVYHCPLAYMNYGKQEKWKDLIPDFETIKKSYCGKQEYPAIEEGNVLIVLSNYDQYYFHSMYYKGAGDSCALEYNAYAHISMFQDSFLISTENENFDLRYFPHPKNIEFYAQETNKKPLYIENVGDATLWAKCDVGLIQLEPGTRKKVSKENVVQNDTCVLSKRDLYFVMPTKR